MEGITKFLNKTEKIEGINYHIPSLSTLCYTFSLEDEI